MAATSEVEFHHIPSHPLAVNGYEADTGCQCSELEKREFSDSIVDCTITKSIYICTNRPLHRNTRVEIHKQASQPISSCLHTFKKKERTEHTQIGTLNNLNFAHLVYVPVNVLIRVAHDDWSTGPPTRCGE